jgi:hypothetical protein
MSSSRSGFQDPPARAFRQGGLSILERQVPPMVVCGQAASRRDVTQLHVDYGHEWVAHHGDSAAVL